MSLRNQLTHLNERSASLFRAYSHVNWALMDQGVVSGVNFLMGILLARYLGIVEFGVFTVAWLVIEFQQSMQQSLIIAPMMSIGPKHSADERPAYMGAIVIQQLCLATLSSLIVISSMLIIDIFVPGWEFSGLIWPLAVAVFICQVQNFVRRYLFVLGRPAAAFLVDVARYGGQFVVLFGFLLTVKMGAGEALWIISGCSAIATILSIRHFSYVTWSIAAVRSSLTRQWDFSKWLLLSELMRWLTGNLFVIASGAMIGAAAVGAIRAAQNLVGICHIITQGLGNIVPISAARRFGEGGAASMVRYLKRFTVYGFLAVGAIVAVAAVAPEFWLRLVYGSGYEGFGYLVQWWAVIYFITFATMPPMFGLRAMERTKSLFWAQSAGAVVSVILIYPFISVFGIVGVMMGNLSIVVTRLSVLLFNFFREIRTQK